MIAAVPTIRFAGYEIASHYTAAGSLVSLGQFSINYGRSNTIEQPTPSRLRASFLADGSWEWITQKPLDQSIEVWIKVGTYQERIFKGTVRSGSVEFLRVIDGKPRYVVEVEATDILTSLGQKYGTAMETYQDSAVNRLAYLASVARGEGVPLVGLGGGTGTLYSLTRKTLAGSVLDEITAVYNVGAEALAYDHHTDRVEASGRPDVHSGALSLKPSTTGKYGITPRDKVRGIPRMKDNEVRAIGPMQLEPQQNVYAVYVVGDLQEASPNVEGWFKGRGKYVSQLGTGGTIAFDLNLDTWAYNYQDNFNPQGVGEAANKWRLICQDAKLPTHPPIRTRHAHGFLDDDDASTNLSCMELRTPVYVPGSPYNLLRETPLIVRVIGGTVSYTAGKQDLTTGTAQPAVWEVDKTFANMPLSGAAITPVSWEAINPAGSLSWDDLDETVTWESARYLTKGI